LFPSNAFGNEGVYFLGRAMHLFDAIRKDPLNYLPEVSLMGLYMFYSGYSFRYHVEGYFLEDNVNHQAFDSWIRARFGVGRNYFNIFSIVRSFAANDGEAFHNFLIFAMSFCGRRVRTRRHLQHRGLSNN
jgi:hypothetical protein